MSRISYIQLKLQTSSRRCLSGSSSCIIRSFSALILSSRRCCAAYNFKTILLFNVRFFLLADKKNKNAKRQNMTAHLLPLGVWLFQEIFLKLAAIFLSFSFRLQVKGKGFFYYHIIALKRTNSIEVFFQVTRIMTNKGNKRPIRTGQFFYFAKLVKNCAPQESKRFEILNKFPPNVVEG